MEAQDSTTSVAPPSAPPPGYRGSAPEQRIVYVERSRNGMAVAALTCGIVGVAFVVAAALLYPVPFALGLVAVVLGIIARRRAVREPSVGRKTMATWGIALGAASVGVGILGASMVNQAVDSLDKVGNPETKTAQLGQPLAMKTQDTTIEVTPGQLATITAGEFEGPSAGNRYVGLRVQIRNTGNTPYDDSVTNGAALIMSDGHKADPTYLSSGPCANSDLQLAPGATGTVCVPFEVSAAATPTAFQLAPDSGFGPEQGKWTL